MKLKHVLILGIASILIWLGTVFLQIYIDLLILKNSFNLFDSPCKGTGYPVAICSTNTALVIAIIALNIGVIGLILYFLLNWWKKTH